MKKLVLALSVASLSSLASAAPTIEELAAQLKAQQAQIDAMAAALEQRQEGGGAAGWWKDTTLGGYGEVHLSHYEGDNQDSIADAHRFVLFVGHQFSRDVRFYSELEIEHGGLEEPEQGAVELEQLYVDWQASASTRLRMGQFLVPVGLINETHEPDSFYGVERNPVESYVVPSTWWEKGVMATVDVAPGLTVDAAMHTGFGGDLASDLGAEGTRELRQELGEAKAEDFAYTTRVRYTGIPGLELGLTAQYQESVTQSRDPAVGGRAPATLVETHVAWKQGAFGVRALYAAWNIDSPLAKAAELDHPVGWYVEPSWQLSPKLGLFARYNQWNVDATKKYEKQLNVGANYWIADRVALKVDLQDTNKEAHEGDGFNLGVGFSF